jgi:hypothetical protein
MSAPSGIEFDFGVNFRSSADRVKGESVHRKEMAGRLLKYHVPFLDETTRGILPHDLVLIGAETGAGKTQLATLIAMSNAKAGKQVHYFALEAEPDEIERRIKFMILVQLIVRRDGRLPYGFTYGDWYIGRFDTVVNELDEQADRAFALEYRNLNTYYRGSKFTHDDIQRLLLAIQSGTDLVILDHLHYVDIDDENENRGFKQTLKMLRDVTLGIGKPLILIAHIRKKDTRSRSIVPDLEMFHGSSEIIKIVTHAVMLAPARCRAVRVDSNGKEFRTELPPRMGTANTFIHVPKDRRNGATGLVALCRFDRSVNMYEEKYTLGRQTGDDFAELETPPAWASNHWSLS